MTKPRNLNIQKKIGFIVGFLGTLVSIINFITKSERLGIVNSLLHPSVSFLLGLSLIFYLTGIREAAILRLIQVAILYCAGIFSILDNHESIFGLGLIFLAVFLSFKYGYLQKRLKLKVGLILLFLFGVIEFSARLDDPGGKWMYGLDSVVYMVCFLLVSYIILKDEIKTALENQRKELLEPIKLEEYGITAAERRVLRVLVTEKASDREIADQIFLSVGTVKNHIHEIKQKLGVSTRYAVIDLCRNNFIEKPREPHAHKTIEIQDYLKRFRKEKPGHGERRQKG